MKHNSLVSSPFGFAIRLKWFKSSLKPTILRFFDSRFAIRKAISESCDTDSNKCLKPHFDGLSIEKCKAFKHEAFACWNNCKMYWFADSNMKDGKGEERDT